MMHAVSYISRLPSYPSSLDNNIFEACYLLLLTMGETNSDKTQLCHDLRPLFGKLSPHTKLKKVRVRLQAQPQSEAVKRLITTHGLDKLCNLTLRLVNEGSLQLPVFALNHIPLMSVLTLLQTSNDEQKLAPDQDSPSEKTSKRTLTGPFVALEEAQSETTIPGRNKLLRYMPMIC